MTDELISQQSFAAPSLAMLTGALKNVAPKIKELKTNSESSNLPCLLTANKMFSAYKDKVSILSTFYGQLFAQRFQKRKSDSQVMGHFVLL